MKTVINGKHSGSEVQFSTALADSANGLIYISETDAPIEPFFRSIAKNDIQSNIAEMVGRLPSEQPEIVSFDRFFERLITDQKCNDNEQSRGVQRFRELKTLLEENLTDLQVARFGKTRIDIYVVGFDQDGNLAGITTRAVET
ncbi:MAG: nuclease A inhibitor family protein [Pyrinomonadaceae bacterium]